MITEKNLGKLKAFCELQNEILNITGDTDILVTFLHDEDITIHNPFLDTTGRFAAEPLEVYEEDDILLMIKQMLHIEEDMGIEVEDMEATELLTYLESVA